MSRHLLGLRELSVPQIQRLLDAAQSYADGERPAGALAGRTIMTLFYEPSTRTEISFELAAKRAGADVVRCDVERSSIKKGESLVDTVRSLEALGADAIVIRHPSAGAPHLASRWVRCAVINAGDGTHEHPTQGLLDLLTVRQRKGRIAGLKVAMVGDVLHSRVARSALWGFTKLGASVTLVGPPTLLPRFPFLSHDGLLDQVDSVDKVDQRDQHRRPISVTMTSSLEEGLQGADVVMALRMQLERQVHGYVPSLAEYTRTYAITPRTLALAKPDALLMHPGPMNLGVEITADVAYGPQSGIQGQVTNGVAVRLAVLLWALDTEEKRERRNAGTPTLASLARGGAGEREASEEAIRAHKVPVISSVSEASPVASGVPHRGVPRGDLIRTKEIASGLRPAQ